MFCYNDSLPSYTVYRFLFVLSKCACAVNWCKGCKSLWLLFLILALPYYIAREKLKQTYEFALDHVGIDFHSTSIWIDYISFLKKE